MALPSPARDHDEVMARLPRELRPLPSHVLPGGFQWGNPEQDRDKAWVAVVAAAAGPVRGLAIAHVAAFARRSAQAPTWLEATEYAARLLAHESDRTCEALTVLVEDTWNSGVDELLELARRL